MPQVAPSLNVRRVLKELQSGNADLAFHFLPHGVVLRACVLAYGEFLAAITFLGRK